MLAILVFVVTMNMAPADHHDRVLDQPRHGLPMLLIDRHPRLDPRAAPPAIKS